jgi:NTP pyrophosphatase (non-canonical NTP hydrolase)
MNFNEYQEATGRTAGEFDDIQTEIIAWSMGIGGEAGEVVDAVKKVAFHGHHINDHEEDIAYELGDLLFYIARMANVLGYNLSEIADMNIEKLKKRYPEGFSTERSVNRDE